MSLSPVCCPKCRAVLAPIALNHPEPDPCPECGTELEVAVFPALFRSFTPGPTAELVTMEGESTCFYHPAKKAIRPCDGCGRFVCALCDCELHGAHYCPSCLEVGRRKGKIKSLENTRLRYDSIALGLAGFPLLFWPISVVTAPVALYYVFRFWNAPRSLIRRSRFRFLLAALLASLEIVGWCSVAYFLINAH